jgi:hypothetical protein
MDRGRKQQKLDFVLNRLQLGWREGFDVSAYREVVSSFPKTWEEHVAYECGQPARKLTFEYRLDQLSKTVRLTYFLDQLLSRVVDELTPLLTEFSDDLESSIYLVLAGHYRQATALLRFACENALLDQYLKKHKKYKAWEEGTLFVPSGNRLIDGVFGKDYIINAELKDHILRLSSFVHTNTPTVINDSLALISFQKKRFDAWYEFFQCSCILITKILLAFQTIRTNGLFNKMWLEFKLATGVDRTSLEKTVWKLKSRE